MTVAEVRGTLSFITLPSAPQGARGLIVPIRQLAIDGTEFGTVLDELVGEVRPNSEETSTPLLPTVPRDDRIEYLNGLLGKENSGHRLQAGRIPIGYCNLCLDGSCGILLAATLKPSKDSIAWLEVGFETELTDDVAQHATWSPSGVAWTPAPFQPEVRFVFARKQYEDAINDELARQ